MKERNNVWTAGQIRNQNIEHFPEKFEKKFFLNISRSLESIKKIDRFKIISFQIKLNLRKTIKIELYVKLKIIY